MIKDYFTLKYALKVDAALYPKQSGAFIRKVINCLVTNPINTQHQIYRYVRALRFAEYHLNNSILCKSKSVSSLWHTIQMMYYYWKLRQISYKTGIQIPPGTCGPGLQIWHYGYIIVNGNARIGRNLTVYPGVEIGHKKPGEGCPVIGDNCFIGAGTKIFGDIHIGNNVTIAANSVVTKDVPDNVIIGGVPANIIKYKNESSTD